jgi:hypothetical protein
MLFEPIGLCSGILVDMSLPPLTQALANSQSLGQKPDCLREQILTAGSNYPAQVILYPVNSCASLP